jgi:hypothetical protein
MALCLIKRRNIFNFLHTDVTSFVSVTTNHRTRFSFTHVVCCLYYAVQRCLSLSCAASSWFSAYECQVRGRPLVKSWKGREETHSIQVRVQPGLQMFCHSGENRNACWISTGNPKGKRPLEKSVSTRRWQNNIKTNPKVGWEGEHRFHLTHDRNKLPAIVNTKLRVPYHAEDMVC